MSVVSILALIDYLDLFEMEMKMVAINTNIASLLAQENSRKVNIELEKAMERLSSGLRINSAGDDAAGLSNRKSNGSPSERTSGSNKKRI